MVIYNLFYRKDIALFMRSYIARRVGCKIVIIFNEISWGFPNKQKVSDLNPDFMIDKFCDLIPLMQSI